MKILILNGPNLNLLGTREPEIYGHTTLADIEARCMALGAELGAEITCRQSNAEHALVEEIQQARGAFDAIIINAAAYTHTSVAIHDALKASGLRIMEVHLSNIHAREAFRHHSHISPIAEGVICGLGVMGYEAAIRALTA